MQTVMQAGLAQIQADKEQHRESLKQSKGFPHSRMICSSTSYAYKQQRTMQLPYLINDDLENRSRRNNLRIVGLPEDKGS